MVPPLKANYIFSRNTRKEKFDGLLSVKFKVVSRRIVDANPVVSGSVDLIDASFQNLNDMVGDELVEGFNVHGRYWIRTSDFTLVRSALYR